MPALKKIEKEKMAHFVPWYSKRFQGFKIDGWQSARFALKD